MSESLSQQVYHSGPRRAGRWTLSTLLLITAWSVAVPVAVLERPGGLRSLGRSRQLVRGNRLSALMVILLVAAVIWIVRFGVERRSMGGSAPLNAIEGKG